MGSGHGADVGGLLSVGPRAGKETAMGASRFWILVGALSTVGSLTWAAQPEAPPEAPRRVIIDTDPGTDDAMAILLALNSPELRVEALTVVPGNATAAQGLENALKLVSLAGRADIPVARGAQKPLLQKLVTAETHGPDGLAGVSLPPARSAPDARFAPDLIIELVHRYPHEITLVPLGPLTNIALALSKDPSIAGLVKEVVLMGGAISGGNVDAVAEFNIYVDPEAAQVVFQGGWPVTMVGLEIGRKALFRRNHLALLQKTHGPQNDFAARVLEYLVNRCEKKYGLEGAPLYDPTAMGAVIDRSLITTRFMHVDVELRGEFTRGETVANRQNALNRKVPRWDRLVFEGTEPLAPNTHVATDIDAERFVRLLIARLAGR
jgi:inosine-uridine nucleoside N-ribohydrolase